jgi:long-subunit acyl-CoA synthetase (AMP-forming)
VCDVGKGKRVNLQKVEPSDVYTFSYTSGTTGTGKAVIISHANLVASIATISN